MDNAVAQDSSSEVQVSSVTIGEFIPLRGCWFQVEASDGHTVTLKVVSVTAGFLKKQSSEWRKKNGKHWRRKARADFAHAANQERKRMAAECRAWLKAKALWEATQGESAGVDADVLLAELTRDDIALD